MSKLSLLLSRTKKCLGLLGFLGLLSACTGGGIVPYPGVDQPRSLPIEMLQSKAVAYSPFRTNNRDTETITSKMILEDLGLLQRAGIGLIRLFDSSDAVARLTLEAISANKLPIKVMLGMYVSPNAESGNQAELDRGIALANSYRSIVVALSVGNETMVSWSFVPQTPATMAGYIKKVRDATTQPITADDNWAFFANSSSQGSIKSEPVLDQIDFVAMHSYPLLDTIHNPGLWDWQQTTVPASSRAQAMMDAALGRLQKEYAAVRSNMDALGYNRLPIVIGETGWKAEVSSGETQRAHPVNQKMYFDAAEAWKNAGNGPKTIVHFEAFDEPWKGGDDKWGLFNVNRQARCVVQGLDATFSKATGSCAATEAAYYQPPSNAGAITAKRFTVYAESTASGEVRPTSPPILNAWENGTTARTQEVTENSGDGNKAMQVNPIPANWGWGMTWAVANVETDLSNFSGSTARLNFKIKTTYPGKIEVGFLTGSATDRTARDVYKAIGTGDYGYANDGSWHLVSIPVADLIAQGAPAYNMPATATLKMDRVSNLFVIADRYDKTGKSANTNNRTAILVDDIYWSY